MGIRKLEVQTDSAMALQLIVEAGEHHPHLILVREARRLVNLDWQVRMLHIYREGNTVVDYLASVGHGLMPRNHSIDNHCSELNYWLYFDLARVQTPHLVVNN
ncbi:unnamed protein product [Linum trigynum]|uniref:RNase H type-1 domain-containing protein n=1 Tax=Linum trigynum TaxID=586398 RepID=A0AAV2DUS3_9ROSI